MDLGLKGKRALVTAASYGLGFASAYALAQEGARICLCSRDQERAEAAASRISRDTGSECIGVAADLTCKSERTQLLGTCNKELGGVDIMVLSTGHPPTLSLESAEERDWERGLDLLLRPVISLTKEVAPQMAQRGYGRLIYIGSIFGLEPESSSIIQSTLRTGLNSFSKCVAASYAAQGVTANVICPGYFETPLLKEVAKGYTTPELSEDKILESWKDFAPAKTFGKPEDLGALVAFLASKHAAFLTGTSIAFDGGAIRSW